MLLDAYELHDGSMLVSKSTVCRWMCLWQTDHV